MTIQEKKLLKKLIAAQISEDREVFVDFINLKASTIHYEEENYTEVDLSEFKNSLQSILRQLEKKDYITRTRWNVTVEHPGFHTRQTAVQKFFDQLMGSVMLPIIVSVITSLLTALITFWFTSLAG